MGKNKNGKGVLSNPFRLKPLDPDDKQALQVVIETPKGSRNKYAFDPEQKIFELKKVLPAGMAFPYDLGQRFVDELKEFFVNYHNLDKERLPGTQCQRPCGGAQTRESGNAVRPSAWQN